MCSCSNELRKGAGIVPMISTLSMKEETFLVLLKDPRVDLNEFYKDTTALGFCLDRTPVWKKAARFLLNDPRTSSEHLNKPSLSPTQFRATSLKSPLWYAVEHPDLLSEMMSDPRIKISDSDVSIFNKNMHVSRYSPAHLYLTWSDHSPFRSCFTTSSPTKIFFRRNAPLWWSCFRTKDWWLLQRYVTPVVCHHFKPIRCRWQRSHAKLDTLNWLSSSWQGETSFRRNFSNLGLRQNSKQVLSSRHEALLQWAPNTLTTPLTLSLINHHTTFLFLSPLVRNCFAWWLQWHRGFDPVASQAKERSHPRREGGLPSTGTGRENDGFVIYEVARIMWWYNKKASFYTQIGQAIFFNMLLDWFHFSLFGCLRTQIRGHPRLRDFSH